MPDAAVEDPDGAEFGYVTRETLPLFTDLYELTMLDGFLQAGHEPEATFSLFFRTLPENRGYLVAAGLEQAVHYLEALHFDESALAYLREEGLSETLIEYLADFEFTGEVHALPEGTPVFPDEPLLEVTAPICQAQLFETLLINQLGFSTLIATKAARMREAVARHGDEATLVDFGSRRAHGTDAGLKAARAAYIGGFAGTSNVAAGEAFDVPVFGTMAHSWVQSFPTERAAFEAFVDVYGEDSILLVDTYDTMGGVETAIEVAREADVDISGVRLDSGDLAELSQQTADRFAETGVDMDVFVSSGIDEYAIGDFYGAGGVADGFGPGTSLVTSADAPTLDIVYKLVAVDETEDGDLEPSMKLSAGKVTYPGPKQVRRIERDGTYRGDVLTTRGDDGLAPSGEDGLAPSGEAALDHQNDVPGTDLLVPVFEDGERVYDLPDLEAIQRRTRREIERLPEDVRALREPASYPVRVGDGLASLTAELEADLEARYGRE